MVGRPSTYRAELATEVCEQIRSGKTLRQIEQVPGLPKHTAICKWLGKYPEFADQYARAREEAADHFADQIVETAQDVRDGTLEPDAGRVIIDALKWSAGKRKPKVYGDRIDTRVDVNVTLRDLVNQSLIDVTPKALPTPEDE